MKAIEKVKKAWLMYDWANSVYPLVITTAIFPIFYEKISSKKIDGQLVSDKVLFFGSELSNTVLISYTSAAIFIIVSLISPFLSGIADYTGKKKQFLFAFFTLGSLSCAGLYFFTIEHIELSLLIYLLAGVGFWGSLVFYNAYLPEIAPVEEHDALSAKGFSYGYLGSSLLLITCLVLIMVLKVDAQWAFVLTGIWWFGFAYWCYTVLPDSSPMPTKNGEKSTLWNGFYELKKVYKQLSQHESLKKYLSSFFIYSMGVQTVMLMAVYFGSKEIAWSSQEEQTTGLIVSVLIIQFIAIAGAQLMASLSARFGNINTLLIVLVLWCFICLSALWVTTPVHFYAIAACVGLVMGGIQSLSRSTYAKLLPQTTDTASYFSFYDVAEKIGIVVGTISYGFIEQITGSMRNSIVAIIVFFVIGMLLLLRVPRDKNLQAIK